MKFIARRAWRRLGATLLLSAIVTLAAFTLAQDGDHASEVEPNDDWATASVLPTDQPLLGSLTPGDVDYFTFTTAGAMAEQLNDLVVDTDVTVTVGLYDAEARLLQERTGAGGALRSLLLPEGQYGFMISGGEGDYTLSFRSAGSPQPGSEREPNDTMSSAQPLDETLTMRGYLTQGDVDIFSFSVPEGGRVYRLQVLGRGTGVSEVTLRSVGGGTIAAASADNGRARIESVELQQGHYYVAISGGGSEYALRILDLAAAAAEPKQLEAHTEDDDSTLTVTTVAEPATRQDAVAAPPPAPSEDECVEPARVNDGEHAFSAAYGVASALRCGELLNTVLDGDEVMLDAEAAAFRFIWVPASRRGTVVKIDTDTGEVLGEYWTAPVHDPERPSLDPSRTVVDRNGNVWVGNRREGPDNLGTVTHIGLLENGQCIDRNGNGVIDTSTGLGDVRPWSPAGFSDPETGLVGPEDECILHHVPVESRGVRHVSVNLDGDVWVSGTSNNHFDLLDGLSGEVLSSQKAPCGGYGGLVDRSGALWSARSLMRWDPSEPLTSETCLNEPSYGIGLGPDDHVWISDFVASVCRFSHDGELEECFHAGEGVNDSRGVAVTSDGHVWVVHSRGDAVTRFAPDGEIVARISVAGRPTGVSIDARGRPWVVANAVHRIDPASNSVDLVVNLDAKVRRGSDELPLYDYGVPYAYSDMTGQLAFGPPDSGSYTLKVRGPSFRTRWESLRFSSSVPDGAKLEVRASTGGGLGAPAGRALVSSGDSLELEGQFLYVEVLMHRAPDGSSPRFGGLEVDGVGIPLDPGSIGVVARPDLVANSNAIEVILDASGSMGISLPSGQSRWEAATEVLLDLAENAFPAGVPLALRVYGHLEPATCHMSLELPLEPFETERFQAAVLGVEPKLLSQTPLADSILAAGDDLADADGRRMVLLITDGEESCGGDPGAAILALRDAGIETVNIVGLALPDDEQVQATFAAWAELGGGVYYDTTSGEELAAALNQIIQPEFVVFDPDGSEVARGHVNSDAVIVPSGVYRVHVYSSPERIVEGVEVVERVVSINVELHAGEERDEDR